MGTWLKNFVEHPRTTVTGLLSGTAAGVVAMGVWHELSAAAGCNWDLVSWQVVVTVVGSALAGLLAGGVNRDRPKAA